MGTLDMSKHDDEGVGTVMMDRNAIVVMSQSNSFDLVETYNYEAIHPNGQK